VAVRKAAGTAMPTSTRSMMKTLMTRAVQPAADIPEQVCDRALSTFSRPKNDLFQSGGKALSAIMTMSFWFSATVETVGHAFAFFFGEYNLGAYGNDTRFTKHGPKGVLRYNNDAQTLDYPRNRNLAGGS
tara:strand:+ start:248 stop:637 length:390 start_codon:yes stop_codon:yes gene_type:complete